MSIVLILFVYLYKHTNSTSRESRDLTLSVIYSIVVYVVYDLLDSLFYPIFVLYIYILIC